MIKINLLGDDTAVNYSARFMLAGYVASIVLTAVIFVVLQRSLAGELTELNQKVISAQAQLDSLKQKTKAVEDLDLKKKVLNSKLALVAKLKRSKIGPVRMLDDLNSAVTARVWLRTVTEKDGEFTIRGRAMGDQDVAQFAQNLTASEYFSEVNLQEVRQMLYSRRTGKVQAMADIKSLEGSGDFGGDSRVSKEDSVKREGIRDGRRVTKDDLEKSGGRKWTVREIGGDGLEGDRNRFIDDNYIKIKEFKLTARVNYSGRLRKVVADAATETAGG
jgi:type IV pilus assembly protein PilN